MTIKQDTVTSKDTVLSPQQDTVTSKDNFAGIERGLITLDQAVRNGGYQGPPGTGVFTLLAEVAAQLGIVRPTFPAETPATSVDVGSTTPEDQPPPTSPRAPAKDEKHGSAAPTRK